MKHILLTPRLVEARARAREVFPKATWLPGDECPVGKEVVRRDGHHAVVLGEVRRHDDATFEWWWEVRDDRYPGYTVLDWPPTLQGASEKLPGVAS